MKDAGKISHEAKTVGSVPYGKKIPQRLRSKKKSLRE